ncbi:hypothetical protein F5Y03DRAFT_401726 [Xylaria venustula]|nr:hypothetical protein F5Y03DRAFT_401726 [Xylaria venustula]
MATSWPQQTAWPTEIREHATYLSKYLQDAFRCVEQAQEQPIPANLVKSMILGMASLVAKTMNMPDVRSIQETLNIIQTEAKNEANITALTLYEIKDDMERTATKLQKEIQESVKNGNEAKVAAKEATKYLFDNFFLPASTKKTPQLSPALHSAVQEAQGNGGQQYVGTGPRLSVLQRDCFIRDRHRCVISRRYDFTEAMNRRRTPGGPRDDDDNLINDPIEPDQLEVAHILPHSVTKTNQKDASKQSALAILDMFDVGVAELTQGPEIDRPRNALTLTHHFHQLFGDFQVYFEPVPDRDHTYTIRTHVSEDYFFR